VVERPASAVKELVENALDAQAARVHVDYAGGGKTLVRVSDDGHGMTPGDLPLALNRHATSKIDGSDLLNIHTFGFRGEALPSLGAVGRLTIATRAEGHEGAEITVEGGKLGRVRPAARNRAAGGKAAVAAGAGLVIMDDGLQNPALKKSMNIVVVKGDMGFGNGHMIPAGPLRETVSAGLSRTHAIISIGDPTHSSLQELPANIPVFRGWYEPLAEDLAALAHKRWVSIAGIAQPDHFPNLLTRHGIEVAHPIALPDHAPISDAMAQGWFEQAQLLDAGLVATAKDWVRLPTVWRPKIRQLRIALIFEDPQGVYELISEKIALTSPPGGPDVS